MAKNCVKKRDTSFSRVLPTSRVGYHGRKPIESVVYCLIRPSETAFLGMQSSAARARGSDMPEV